MAAAQDRPAVPLATQPAERSVETGRFDRAIESVATPIARARACLDAAGSLLCDQCEPSLRALLAGRQVPADELAASARAGLAYLDRAEAAVAEAGEAEADEQSRLRRRAALLRAFGEVFIALAAPADSSTAHASLNEAGGGLAIYLDHADATVVESARLWQGVAYRRAGRPDRALLVLRPMLEAPTDRRLGLWIRLQRCLALADAGRHVAALALCSRLKARVPDWFVAKDADAIDAANATIAHVRVRLLRSWAAAVRNDGDDDAASEIEKEARTLVDSAGFSDAVESLLPLGRAVAVPPPERDRPDDAETTTRPAPADDDDFDIPPA